MRRPPLKTILFVCTANICRSPMAASIMRRRLDRAGLAAHVEVASAGVWAESGHKASAFAGAVLGSRGMDLSGHASRLLTPAMLREADIVIVMEESHRQSIFHLAPQHLGKVYLLSEMAGKHDDVADPYGGPIEGYETTADLLEELIDAGLPGILKRIGVQTEIAA